jgi:hypothetical protein
MSERELWNLDTATLYSLYEQETEKLHQKLLSGVPWEETAEQRKQLSAYSMLLYKKRNETHFNNPAEKNCREEER